MIEYYEYGSFKSHARLSEKEAEDAYRQAYRETISDTIKGCNKEIQDADTFYKVVQNYFYEILIEILRDKTTIYREDIDYSEMSGERDFDNYFLFEEEL